MLYTLLRYNTKLQELSRPHIGPQINSLAVSSTACFGFLCKQYKPLPKFRCVGVGNMAAKDSAGFQEFPRATFAVPPKAEMEERSALAFNLRDGQQSMGQSTEDPYTRAVKYLEKHRIVEVFQVTIVTLMPQNSK